MGDTLLALLAEMPLIADEAELRQKFAPRLSSYFSAQRCAIFVLKNMDANKLAAMQGNPVVRYLLERHAPVHEEIMLSPGQWQVFCQRLDHGHVMAGPVICRGELHAVLGLTRAADAPAFTSEELADLTALCLHLSSWFAARRPRLEVQDPGAGLTEREKQIGERVARGLTNAQIGAELCISENTVKAALKAMFRKLQVVSRAELVARLGR